MTYSTSHLGISVLIIYFLFPKSIKNYLKANPKIFFLTSLGAVLPDLDLVTNGHRAYGHSVLFPLFLMAIAPIVEDLLDRENFSLNLRIFSVFWISHMIYDTTFGPLALFFPVDQRFYDISIGIVLDLGTAIVAPKGLFVSIDFIDQRTGVSTFFVNWTPEQRVQAFGTDTIRWPISDFFLHATLFIWYLLFVILPLLRALRKNHDPKVKQEGAEKVDFQFPKWGRLWVNPLILLLLTTALFIAGPAFGPTWTDAQQDSGSVWVSNDNIRFLGVKSVKVPEGATLNITTQITAEDLNYSVFIAITSAPDATDIQNKIFDILEDYDNRLITYSNAINQYQRYIQENIPAASSSSINQTNALVWKFISIDEPVTLVYGLYNWNSSLSFSNSFRFSYTWEVPRNSGYLLGTVVFVLSLLLSVSSVLRTYWKYYH